jgi:hypothetical protein
VLREHLNRLHRVGKQEFRLALWDLGREFAPLVLLEKCLSIIGNTDIKEQSNLTFSFAVGKNEWILMKLPR